MSNLDKNTRGRTKTAVYGMKVGPTRKRNLMQEARRFTAMSLQRSSHNRRHTPKVTSQ
jgi:hypothetical protein